MATPYKTQLVGISSNHLAYCTLSTMIDYLGRNQDITKDLVDVVNMSSNVTPAGFYGERQFGWSQYRKLDFFLRKTGISSSYLTFYLLYLVFNETNVASSIYSFQFKAFDYFLFTRLRE